MYVTLLSMCSNTIDHTIYVAVSVNVIHNIHYVNVSS